MTTAGTTTPQKRRNLRSIDHQFSSGGQSDFALLGALVPNDPDARAVLRSEAAKRGLSVEGILRRVVDTMIGDRLFAAVLDDADEIGRLRG